MTNQILTGNGTTSACAENTTMSRGNSKITGNYLRVRGEYTPFIIHTPRPKELPPRARRIHTFLSFLENVNGTTSACAENTIAFCVSIVACRNYLRVRGEYICGWSSCGTFRELPPRARRIPVSGPGGTYLTGTTSACAENTIQTCILSIPRWNYLRVRGEYGWA